MLKNPDSETVLQEIHNKLSQFSNIVMSYRESLISELRLAEEDPEPYDSYLWTLNRQIDNLDNLENTLETEVQPLLKLLGK